MTDISYSEYWIEVCALAQSITEEAKEYDRDISEVLHETIDGHEWVIYTHSNFDVSKHSPNSDAWQDCYESGELPDNFDAIRAFCALEADVREHSDFNKEEE